MNKHIILVGFMCSGKTTFGKKLAHHLKMPFIDIDEYISQKQNKTVAGIFSEYGELYFRELERRYLDELLQMEPAIIASGGGTPCFNNNMQKMNQYAVTVYLQADPIILFGWLKQAGQERPLLKGKTDDELLQFVENLLERRREYYEMAHITLSALHPDTNSLLDKLQSFL